MKLLKLMNPIEVTKGAFGLAGSAVGIVETVARGSVHLVLSGLHELRTGGDRGADTAFESDAWGTGSPSPAEDPVTEVEVTAPKGPDVVLAEPHAPEQPPVDVVGQALAAEAAMGDREVPEGAGVAHEPRGASRDEEHGDAALPQSEADGIAEEVTAALEGDVEPDEEHLTQPLIDPAEANALAAEMKTLRRAADPHKG